MRQQLGTLIAPTEDTGSVPRTLPTEVNIFTGA